MSIFQLIPALFGAKAKAQGFRDQQAAAQIEAAQHKLRGVQIGEQSRDQLNRTLAAISTIRAQRGLSNDSETAQALERKTTDNAYRNEAVQVLGELNAQQASIWAAKGYRRAAKSAIPMALMQWGADTIDDGAKAYAAAAGGG